MKVLLLISSLVFISLQSIAQKGCNAVFTKGQKLHYIRQDAPSITNISNIDLLKLKELKPVQQKLNEDVKAHFVKEKEYSFDIQIAEVNSQYKTILKSIE